MLSIHKSFQKLLGDIWSPNCQSLMTCRTVTKGRILVYKIAISVVLNHEAVTHVSIISKKISPPKDATHLFGSHQ
jgi:hypothetical protein